MGYVLLYSKPQSCNHQRQIQIVKCRRTMPIQAPSWTEFLLCPICSHDFAANLRAPITLGCGHTLCKNCLANLHRKQCPFDQTNITKDLDNLPVNNALLQLVTSPNNAIDRDILPSIVQTLTGEELQLYKQATRCIEELALYLKPNGQISGFLSRPMQRKLVTLINCQLIEDEGRSRSLRAARSLGERTVTELILQHQNPQQLNANLWAAVRARGCQFLGPEMQDEVLKLVLLALEDGCSLSRKVLVLYVVQQLIATYPQASKTSIGHVVQLLYRASCFKVSKRDGDSSLMTLKEEFRTYEALRREHDTQIVQIATEAGLRIAPDQWSSLLYADSNHKSHMQSIIDKQQSPSSFAQSVHELVLAIQRTSDPANLSRLRAHLNHLANIDPAPEPNVIPTWQECASALDAVAQVVNGLVDFVQHHGNRKAQETSYMPHMTSRYKSSYCREFMARGNCARGQNCSFAHSNEEMERYNKKFKKNQLRLSAAHNQIKEPSNFSVPNGPNQKVNINHSTYAKNHDISPTSSTTRFNKATRSENSLQPVTNHYPHNHLRPANIYPNASSSSSSTPNLSLQHSPNQQNKSPNGPQRFAFAGNGSTAHNNYAMENTSQQNATQMNKFINYRPPLSAPPITQNTSHGSANHSNNGNNNGNSSYGKSLATGYSSDYKKQLSPFHNNNNNNNVPMIPSPSRMQNPPPSLSNNNGRAYFALPPPASYNQQHNRGEELKAHADAIKFLHQWNCQEKLKPPNTLMPKSNTTSHKSAHTSPINRNMLENTATMMDFKRNTSRMMNVHPSPNASISMYQQQQSKGGDEVDGSGGMGGNVWNYAANQPSTSSMYQFNPPSSGVAATVGMGNSKFIRSDSILTSNTDDSFDILPTNGKYGAIGIKNTDIVENNAKAPEWSGLQQTLPNRFDSSYDIVSAGDTLKNSNNYDCSLNPPNTAKNSNSEHLNIRFGNNLDRNSSSYGLNGNFLSIGDTQNKSSNDQWWFNSVPEDTIKDFDIDPLGNGMCDLKLW